MALADARADAHRGALGLSAAVRLACAVLAATLAAATLASAADPLGPCGPIAGQDLDPQPQVGERGERLRDRIADPLREDGDRGQFAVHGAIDPMPVGEQPVLKVRASGAA